MKSTLLAVLLVAACDDGRPAGLDDCGGDLRGVWRDGAGHRFAVIGGRGWEWYPMTDDRPGDLPAGVIAAPAMLSLTRTPGGEVSGDYSRRYERGDQICRVRTPARLHDCRGHRVELDVRPPPLPTDFATCATPAPDDVAVETWILLRD